LLAEEPVKYTGFARLEHSGLAGPPPVVLELDDVLDDPLDDDDDDALDDDALDDPPVPMSGGSSGRIPFTSPVTRAPSNGSHCDSVHAFRNCSRVLGGHA
jgi:hypothetical protein